jgi:thymidine phosphorylase
MLIPEEIIRIKRDGHSLTTEDIQAFVRGIGSGQVSDAQIGAMNMAIFLIGMDDRECTDLTLAMRDSGKVFDWSGMALNGPVVDKHSTGGVGDYVSLPLGPILAACGAYVPMVTGAGLGHTGGTVDKMQSIPGYNVRPNARRMQAVVKDVGVAITGQTSELAPADQRVYAVRDVTATIDSIPLITASILSKKMAEGLDVFVMDIKTGNGAFLRTPELSAELARSMATVAESAGLKCNSFITDMSQPLGSSAGNAVEVQAAIDYLTGAVRNRRFDQVTRALACEALIQGHICAGQEEAQAAVSKALDSGAAADRFEEMVSELGGPSNLVERPQQYLTGAPVIKPVMADTTGYVTEIETRKVGFTVVELGGGRLRAGDAIDHRVGLTELAEIGQQVDADSPIAMIHAASESDYEMACEHLKAAYTIAEEALDPPQLFY